MFQPKKNCIFPKKQPFLHLLEENTFCQKKDLIYCQKTIFHVWKKNSLHFPERISCTCLKKKSFPHENNLFWLKKSNEKSLPEKEDFYSHFYIEVITNADYMHSKSYSRFWNKKFTWIPLFVGSRPYIIASWCIWTVSKYVLKYETLNLLILSALGLAGQEVLKKPKYKIRSITWYWYVTSGRRWF